MNAEAMQVAVLGVGLPRSCFPFSLQKRPYNGELLTFSPQDHGRYRIRLVARAPGEDARELSEAVVELRA